MLFVKVNGVSLSPDKRCIFLIFLYLFGKLNNPVKFTLVWILRCYKLYIQTKQITAVTLSPKNNKEKTQSRKKFYNWTNVGSPLIKETGMFRIKWKWMCNFNDLQRCLTRILTRYVLNQTHRVVYIMCLKHPTISPL